MRTETRRKGGPLGYEFDPVPRALHDAINADAALGPPPLGPPPDFEPPPGADRADAWRKERRRVLNDRLRPVDATVMASLLRFPRPIRHVCWTTVGTLAARVRKSPRTVKYALRRLSLPRPGYAPAGFVEQAPVAVPDPDLPGNETGWRLILLWLAPPGYRRGDGPDRRPPSERKVWVRTDGGRKPVAPPPLPLFDPPVAPAAVPPVAREGVAPVASKPRAGASNPVLDGGELETTPSSSSARATAPSPAKAPAGDDDDDRGCSPSGEEKTPEPGWLEAVVEVARGFSPDAARDVRIRAPGLVRRELGGDPGPLLVAVREAVQRGPTIRKTFWGYVRALAIEARDDGITAPTEDLAARRAAEHKAAWEALAGEMAKAARPPEPAPPAPPAEIPWPEPGTREHEARTLVERCEGRGFLLWPDGKLVRVGLRAGTEAAALWADPAAKAGVLADLAPRKAEILAYLGERKYQELRERTGMDKPQSQGTPWAGGKCHG